MKIILANPRGFCAGVNMAIECLEARPRILRAAALRLSRDRPQQVSSSSASGSAGPSSSSRSTKFPRVARCSTAPTASRRRSATRPASGKLLAIDATCPLVTKVHLEAVKYATRRVHDHPHRPRGPRRGHRHHGRSARPDGPGRDGRRRRSARGPRRQQSCLSDPDDAQCRRRQHRDRRTPRTSSPRSPTRPRTTSATPPRTARRPSANWPRRPTWCSCSAARTARTASGWPRSPMRWASPAHLIDGVAEIQRSWFDRRRDRPDHRRRQRAGGRCSGVHRVSANQLRRDRSRKKRSDPKAFTSRCPSRSGNSWLPIPCSGPAPPRTNWIRSCRPTGRKGGTERGMCDVTPGPDSIANLASIT